MASAEPAAGTVTLTYNADGQRVAKQGTDGSVTGFLYDYKKLLHETDEVGGSITDTYLTTSDQEFGDLIGEDEQPYFHQYDAQANTNALLDGSGVVAATYKYYAFGLVAAINAASDTWESLSLDQSRRAGMTVDQWWNLPLGQQRHRSRVVQRHRDIFRERCEIAVGGVKRQSTPGRDCAK